MTSALVGAGVVALVTGTLIPDMEQPDNLALVDANAAASEAAERAGAVNTERATRADAGRGAGDEVGSSSVQVGPPDVYFLPLRAYTLTSKFGFRHLNNQSDPENHPGIDLAADKGTPYYAVARGKVILARAYGGYGNCIMIDHGGGVVSLYGHSSRLRVKEGDVVEAGQVIGEVGDTGYSFGPHLHLEIRIDGQRQDPIPYLKGKGADVPGKTDPLTAQ